MKTKTNQIKLTLAVTLTLILAFSLSSVQFAYADVLFGGGALEQVRKEVADSAKTYFDEHKDQMQSGEWFYFGEESEEGFGVALYAMPYEVLPITNLECGDIKYNYVFAVDYKIADNDGEWGYVDFNSEYNKDIPLSISNLNVSGGWVFLDFLKETDKTALEKNPPLTDEERRIRDDNGTIFGTDRNMILFIVLAAVAVAAAVILIVTISRRRRRKGSN